MDADGESGLAARRESSGNAEAPLTDQEDGYFSPAEDTSSVFSDEQSGRKPYAQARL
jgi:hypothetical protein